MVTELACQVGQLVCPSSMRLTHAHTPPGVLWRAAAPVTPPLPLFAWRKEGDRAASAATIV